MSHAVKQFLESLATPLVGASLLALLAGGLSVARQSRVSRWLLLTAALIAYAGATPFVGRALITPLESRYPPLQTPPPPSVRYVVVLGSAYNPHNGIPVTAALYGDGLVRIVEGIRLVRQMPGATLIVSGGAVDGPPAASGYAQLAIDLGLEKSSVTALTDPLDTASEARDVVALIGAQPFLLVTSASHMPRAMRLMQRAGARPIPAPTLQRASANYNWHLFLPSSDGLRDSEHALHEYLGLAAMSVGIAP